MSIVDDAVGRWPMILRQMGVDDSFLTGKHGPCPVCGGKDRFRFTDYEQRGMWICNQHGSGDGWNLLEDVCGLSFKEACREVEKLIPTIKIEPAKRPDTAKARAALNAMRELAVPTDQVPDVAEYLAGRGLEVPPGIQAAKSLPYYEDKIEVGRYPVMLGKMVLPNNKPVSYHRTYISNGKKAPVDSPRKMMPPAQSIEGAAIRLYPAAEVLGIAEGIETAIAAKMGFGIPVWSSVTAEGMKSFEPPEGVTEVVIFGDNDSSFTGQLAAYQLANRLYRSVKVKVEIPPSGDWADWIK